MNYKILLLSGCWCLGSWAEDFEPLFGCKQALRSVDPLVFYSETVRDTNGGTVLADRIGAENLYPTDPVNKFHLVLPKGQLHFTLPRHSEIQRDKEGKMNGLVYYLTLKLPADLTGESKEMEKRIVLIDEFGKGLRAEEENYGVMVKWREWSKPLEGDRWENTSQFASELITEMERRQKTLTAEGDALKERPNERPERKKSRQERMAKLRAALETCEKVPQKEVANSANRFKRIIKEFHPEAFELAPIARGLSSIESHE